MAEIIILGRCPRALRSADALISRAIARGRPAALRRGRVAGRLVVLEHGEIELELIGGGCAGCGRAPCSGSRAADARAAQLRQEPALLVATSLTSTPQLAAGIVYEPSSEAGLCFDDRVPDRLLLVLGQLLDDRVGDRQADERVPGVVRVGVVEVERDLLGLRVAEARARHDLA